ncbi:MAG: hypothetical protein ACLUD2_14670 [Clostridium sp.]
MRHDDFYTGTIASLSAEPIHCRSLMAFGPHETAVCGTRVKEYHRLADGNAVVDYGFHGVFQHVNPQVLEEMGEIAKEEGITSFKVYMTYGYGLGDSDLMQILTRDQSRMASSLRPTARTAASSITGGKNLSKRDIPRQVSSDQPSGSGEQRQ